MDPTILLLSAIGASTAGQVQQSRFQQKIAQQNQQLERQTAELEASNLARRRARDIATVRARQGASGVDVNTGSALAVQADLAREAELERLTVLFGGELGAREQGIRGTEARARSRGAITSGVLSGLTLPTKQGKSLLGIDVFNTVLGSA